ncbi:MAG: hypothetical protein RR672_00020 [Raoultibacter sp.]
MKTLSGSLAALAIVAARDGQWTDVARLIAQAACAPDTEEFLECQLQDNFEANCLVNSVSGVENISESVSALSAALALNAEEEKVAALYDGDEVISLNSTEEDDSEEEQEDAFIESSSSCLLRLRLD